MPDAVTIALAGDTMLGRNVGERLRTGPAASLFDPALLEILSGTDGTVLNLECCISEGGAPWPGRVFHFRAPPAAVDALQLLGVRCVTLANNHALDFGEQALLDTLRHLSRAGIAVTGAGPDVTSARAPAVVRLGSLPVTVVGLTDDPAEYAATADRPGVAYADLRGALPDWVAEAVGTARSPVLVSPHWGPNMTSEPVPHVQRAAAALVAAGATVVAGHSAHVFHGVRDRVLFDMGDLVDDYVVDPVLRNDLGALWLLHLDAAGSAVVEVVPLRLRDCRTELARGQDAAWVRRRFRLACQALGTEVADQDGHLTVRLQRDLCPLPP